MTHEPTPQYLSPKQAWTLLGIHKTQFYAVIKAANLQGVQLPGMSSTLYKREDLLTLHERMPGSAVKAGFNVSPGFEDISIYDWKKNEAYLATQP